MPDGKNHNMINITVLIVILSGIIAIHTKSDLDLTAYYLNFRSVSIFSMCYLFGTLFLSPDLDIQSAPYERWGPLKCLWWPYKIMFKHRGISHHPVFGPLSIFMNFSIILVPLLFFMKFEWNLIPAEIGGAIILGILASIELHILADMVVSELN